MFGRHQSGFLIPMLLCVKSLPSGFAGVMQRLHTNENFILFCSVSGRVCGGSLDSLHLLGDPDPVDVDDGEISLWRFLDQPSAARLFKCYEDTASRAGNRVMHSVQVQCERERLGA